MPPNGEKRPRWLISCKCGARVKASRQAIGNRRFLMDLALACQFGREANRRFRNWQTLERALLADSSPSSRCASGLLAAERPFIVRNLAVRRQQGPFTWALEQHASLECARSHEREPLEHPLAYVRIFRSHKADGLD